MLSYQHAFHAGNHADVLKHAVVIGILAKLKAKNKPFFALDTHAGAGLYDLTYHEENSDYRAYEGVIDSQDSLGDLAQKALADYAKLIKVHHGRLQYPGSSYLIAQYSRDMDSIHANELNKSMYETLKRDLKPFATHVHQRDAFEILKGMLPPQPKRGLVLVDPPYEQAAEYAQVIQSIQHAVKVWPSGVYCIWYPLLSPQRIDRKTQKIVSNPKSGLSQKMLKDIRELAHGKCTNGVLDVRFAYCEPSIEQGMYGSGVCIVNPPYLLYEDMQRILDSLCKSIKADDNSLSTMSWLLEAQ